MKCFVIIPAAGSGIRFGSATPKQFMQLHGRPLIAHAIDRFLAHQQVELVVVAVAPGQSPEMDSLLGPALRDRVTIVAGGTTRARSVRNALSSISSSPSAELIAVHDAVRPFFSNATFETLLREAATAGGAIPVLPIVETVHKVEESKIVRTEDRASLVRAQTPQCFRTEVLIRAFRSFEDDSASDEAALVVRSGGVVKVVEGDVHNIKITTPQDLELAEKNFEEWSRM